MEKLKFKIFKEEYLDKFRIYYKDEGTNRRKLKDSVFNNPKLTNIQKKRFWKLVKKSKENNKRRIIRDEI